MVSEKTRLSLTKLFWGRAEQLPWYSRVGGLVFVVVAIASMSFCQFGFLPLGDIEDYPIYLILVLAPVIMGSLAFGPLTGTLIGLFGGFIAFVHGVYLPLDYLEAFFFGTPLNTIVLFGFTALVAGLLFDVVLKRNPQGVTRVVLISAVCVVASFLVSALVLVNTLMLLGGLDLYKLAQWYMGLSVEASALQALGDSVLIAGLCLFTDFLMRTLKERGSDRGLFPVFRNMLALVSAIVFMSTSAVIFSNTTIREYEGAVESMEGELEFLQFQINRQPDLDAQMFLGGYDAEPDGVVFTLDNRGNILASNDDKKFKVGSTLFTAVGLGDYLGDDDALESLLVYYSSGRESIIPVQDTDDELVATMNPAYLGIRKCDGGYVALHYTGDLVYANRLDTMMSSTALALVLVAAIALLASVLVRNLIVRRIDDANRSLARITEGNLDERLPEQSTREFTSLADGINSTVVALGNMIDEVARRNEQDLATAKTIQESSLPTEFPAFPDIDKFDIYASMKTAKEVGGDFYDFFPIEDTTRIGFVMADVSGKGIPAALFMMAARSQLRNFMEAGLPLDEAVNAANHHLCDGNDAGMFVTCWVAELDYETGELAYVNAGHNPPMLMHDGTWKWVTDISGMPLGLFDGIPYDLYTMQLEPGDTIYTYTDGVTEAMNVADELFGEERLEAVLNQNKDMNPRSVGVAVRRALADYTLGAEQSDDITMLIMKYGVPPETGAVMVLPADSSQLMHVRSFIDTELDRRKAPKHIHEQVGSLASELFASACRHAYPDATPDNPGVVRIGYEYQAKPRSLTVTVSDEGVLRDPLAEIDVSSHDETSESPSDNAVALEGLRNVDDASYEHAHGCNIVSFSKGW